jgi:hypothetical protein
MNKHSKYVTSKFHLLTLLFVSAIVMTSIIPNMNKLGGNMSNIVFAQGNQTADLNEFNSFLNSVPIEPREEETSDIEDQQDTDNETSDAIVDDNDQQNTIPEEDLANTEDQQDTDNETSDAIVDDNDQQNVIPEELELEQNSTEETPSNDNLTVIVDPYLNNSRSGGEVTLTNINTIPQQVHVGDEFKIQATIQNNLNESITYKGKMCGESPINTNYDDKVTINQLVHCDTISTDTLGPNERATVESTGYEIPRAISPGISNVDLTFYYKTENSPNQGIVPTSFSFDILPSANQSMGVVELTDLKTIPQQVRVGDLFKIQATVKNGLNEPITYIGNTCAQSPLNVNYDDKVVVEAGVCASTSTDTLGPNETAVVTSTGYEIPRAISPGTSPADVFLHYNTQSTPATRTITASLTFDIVNATAPKNVVLSDFKINKYNSTEEGGLETGTPFTYQVKVTNNLNTTIVFQNSCTHNNHGYEIVDAIERTDQQFCNGFAENLVVLQPGEQSTLYGPGNNKGFEYSTSGYKTITLNWFYNIGSSEGELGTVSKQFGFVVNDQPDVVLSDFKTSPSKLFEGTQFTYQVKVTNKMSIPIFFYNSCDKSDLQFNFNDTYKKDATLTQNSNYFCDALPTNKIQLNPNESTVAFGPYATKGVISFNTDGIKKIILFLSYNAGNVSGEPGIAIKTFDIKVMPKISSVIENPTIGKFR